jgi:hypothetical protein
LLYWLAQTAGALRAWQRVSHRPSFAHLQDHGPHTHCQASCARQTMSSASARMAGHASGRGRSNAFEREEREGSHGMVFASHAVHILWTCWCACKAISVRFCNRTHPGIASSPSTLLHCLAAPPERRHHTTNNANSLTPFTGTVQSGCRQLCPSVRLSKPYVYCELLLLATLLR